MAEAKAVERRLAEENALRRIAEAKVEVLEKQLEEARRQAQSPERNAGPKVDGAVDAPCHKQRASVPCRDLPQDVPDTCERMLEARAVCTHVPKLCMCMCSSCRAIRRLEWEGWFCPISTCKM